MRAPQLLSLLMAGLASGALPTIETYGNKFYDANGKQFFMKGKAFNGRASRGMRPSSLLMDEYT